MARDNLALYNRVDDFKIKCYACDEPDHIATRCPHSHYVRDRIEAVNKYVLTQSSFGSLFERRRRLPAGTLWLS